MSEELSAEELASDLVPAVNQQISSPETPFVGMCYQRLVTEETVPSLEAKKMIALCLADEVEAMERENRAFSLARYEGMLQFLPVLPE